MRPPGYVYPTAPQMTNLRQSRFTGATFAYDPAMNGRSLAASPAEVATRYPYTQLSNDGDVVIRLHTPKGGGQWVDDLIGLSRVWLRSLPQDDDRRLAAKLLYTATCVLDARATAVHGWSGSAEERATPPDYSASIDEGDYLALRKRLGLV